MTLDEDSESNANDDSDVDIMGNSSDVDIIDLDHCHHAGKATSVKYIILHDVCKSVVRFALPGILHETFATDQASLRANFWLN